MHVITLFKLQLAITESVRSVNIACKYVQWCRGDLRDLRKCAGCIFFISCRWNNFVLVLSGNSLWEWFHQGSSSHSVVLVLSSLLNAEKKRMFFSKDGVMAIQSFFLIIVCPLKLLTFLDKAEFFCWGAYNSSSSTLLAARPVHHISEAL